MGSWSTQLVAVAVAAATLTADGGPDGDLAGKLRSAGNALMAATERADPSGVRPALAEIVGIAAAAAARGGVPQGVATRLGAARVGLQASAGPSSDGDAVRELGEVYAALHEGRRFSMPADVRTLEQAREACRRGIDAAAAALESGRRDDAVRRVVVLALLVMTPFEPD